MRARELHPGMVLLLEGDWPVLIVGPDDLAPAMRLWPHQDVSVLPAGDCIPYGIPFAELPRVHVHLRPNRERLVWMAAVISVLVVITAGLMLALLDITAGGAAG